MAETTTNTSARIKPHIGAGFIRREAADIKKLRDALNRAEQDIFPDRTELIRIYKDAVLDSHLSAVWELQRKAKLLSLGFSVLRPDGDLDEVMTKYLHAPWFTTFCGLAFDSKLWGYELIQFGDVVNGAFSEVQRVPHHLVIPERQECRTFIGNQRGISYVEPPYQDWYLGIGAALDYGLLLKAAFYTLSKRYVKASWDEFAMDFGMPTRVIETDADADDNAKDEMTDAIRNAGRGAVIALNKGDDFRFLQAQNVDAFKVYQENLAYCNAEISKLIVGQTMTTENGSSYSQAAVHERVGDTLLIADSQWLADVINTKLFPFMRKHGMIGEGYTFQFDQQQELNLTGMNLVMQTLLQSGQYTIPAEYIERKFGFEVELKQVAPPEPEVPVIPINPAADGGQLVGKPVKAVAMLLPTSSLVTKAYGSACGHNHGHVITGPVAADQDWFNDNELEGVVREFYGGTYSDGNLPKSLQKKLFDVLWGGAKKGVETEIKLDQDPAFGTKLKENVAAFSAAKTWQQAKEYSDLLSDITGKQREWPAFKQEAMKVAKEYNQDHLRTEYETAVAAGQMAGLWKQAMDTVGLDGLVMYDTAGDARVRPEHKAWDGIVKPLGDAFWNTHWPPNGYRCRCSVRIMSSGQITPVVPTKEDPTIPTMFKFNPGKSAMIFSPDHPYWDIPAASLASVSKMLGKSAEELMRDNQQAEVLSVKKFMNTDLAKKYKQEIKESGGFAKGSTLSKAEQIAVRAYTEKSVAYKFNAATRKNYPNLQDEMEDQLFGFVLGKAIDKGPQHNGISIRTLGETEALMYINGEASEFRQFTSATVGLQPVVSTERQYRLVLAGVGGAVIEKLSKVQAEKEVLYKPGTKFVVTKITENGNVVTIFATHGPERGKNTADDARN